MTFDTAIVGGGPAGLSAALQLGRARKQVVLLDGKPRRNARAEAVHGFLTRDGIAPDELRRVARLELAPYGTQFRDSPVRALAGEAGHFELTVDGSADVIRARSVVLALGMIDESLALPGFADLWGHSIFQCPFCHGWEIRGQAFGILAPIGIPAPMLVHYAVMIRSWTDDLIVFTDGVACDAETAATLSGYRIGVESRKIAALEAGESAHELAAVLLDDGTRIARRAIFTRPPQRQTELVQSLGLELDDMGMVKVDDWQRTSRSGVYAAGDLCTPAQSAIFAAAAGARAGGALVHELTAHALRA